jgi:hypothetical protein
MDEVCGRTQNKSEAAFYNTVSEKSHVEGIFFLPIQTRANTSHRSFCSSDVRHHCCRPNKNLTDCEDYPLQFPLQ